MGRKNEDLRSCHILFISNSEAKSYARILKKCSRGGDSDGWRDQGFPECWRNVEFLVPKTISLQFEVNLVAADEAHLRVSSKLLALARRVVRDGLIER
jgi:hypothetical protein